MTEIQETVELVHRIVGYPLAFIVGLGPAPFLVGQRHSTRAPSTVQSTTGNVNCSSSSQSNV